jgi:hypothetical protein
MDQWQEIRVEPLRSGGAGPARALPPRAREHEDLADAVARESSGNPFFLSELARSLRGQEIGSRLLPWAALRPPR